MNQQLSIHTLGGVRVEAGQSPITKWQSRKAEALLIYLAVTRRVHKRESLVGLLWAEMPQERALANLSVMLSNIRKNVGADFLLADRQQVGLDWSLPIWVDVDAFTTKIGELLGDEPLTRHKLAQLEKSLALYHGDFLQGYYIRGANEFEEWGLFKQERLSQMAITGWQALVTGYLRRGEGVAGIPHAQKLLDLDPLRENTHRDLMQLYALADQRSLALGQYEKCRQILQEKLGIKPEPQTITLFKQIKAGEKIPSLAPAPMFARSLSPRHNLPAQTTPFIGRQAELNQIQQQLNNPHCRMLTLVGWGGSGKTRIGQKVGKSVISQYINGVWFVPLAGLDINDIDPEIAINLLLTTIAETLPFTFSGQEKPFTQLLDYLRERELLLILDNFEHLVSLGNVLTQLLASAPDLKLLITSRERVKQSGEWVVEIGGMTLPNSTHDANWDAADAVQLFVQTANRIQTQFEAKKERHFVGKICRLVAGVPLALQLAASWVSIYSCQQIVAEIEKTLSFLQTNTADLANRHRSVQAVFEHSWQLLTAEEQGMFRRLSVFRGGFTVEAAREVAGISPTILLQLLHKSLIQKNSPERFDLHELVRQFVAEKLTQYPDDFQHTRQKHAEYFSHFVKDQEVDMYGNKQTEALATLLLEIDNIRRTWRWGVLQRQWQIFSRMWNCILIIFDTQGMYGEAIELAQQAFNALKDLPFTDDEARTAYGEVVGAISPFSFRIGEYDKALAYAQKSVAILASCPPHYAYGHALLYVGIAYYPLGDLENVVANLEKAEEAYRAAGFMWGVGTTLGNLAEVYLAQNDLELAEQCALRALAEEGVQGNAYPLSGINLTLGMICLEKGDIGLAKHYAEICVDMCRQIEYRGNLSGGLALLARIAATQGDVASANAYFEESVALLREDGSHLYLASRLLDWAKIAIIQQDWQKAYFALVEVVEDSVKMGAVSLGMPALLALTPVYEEMNRSDLSQLILHFVAQHGGDTPEKAEAEKLLGEMPAFIPPIISPTQLSEILLELRRHPIF